MKRIRAFCFGLLFSVFYLGAGVAQTNSDHPDLSGYWALEYDSMDIPVASLTPPAASADKQKQFAHDQLAIRWCDQLGTPAMMDDREPLDIEQSAKEIAIVAHAPSSVRYIYTDGRSHPNKDEFDPTTNGNSIGHWDGKTLLVDTVYFNDRGVTMLPGGGVRTPNSHLVERYTLSDDGQRLTVRFTWSDPKVFAAPHTYGYMYYKTKSVGEPRIAHCDASDPQRANFLVHASAGGRGSAK